MSSINARVPPPRLMAIDTPSDGQIPAYQASSGEFEWVDDSSGGTPGGATTQIQYNNSGAFAGDAGLIISTAGGGASTQIQVGSLKVGGSVNALAQQTLNGSLLLQPEGTGQLTISPGGVGGGTQSDIQVNVVKQAPTDEAIIELKGGTGTVDIARIKLDGASDLILDNSYNTNKDLDLKIEGTGQVEIANQTTNTDTILSVKGNGTGDAKINLNNPTKAITLICDTNQKLKVAGGVNSFVFDASSGTGGITWPDGTTQTTAASGVSFPLEAPNGSAAAPSYSFSSDTDTGFFRSAANQIKVSTGGTANHIFNTTNMQGPSGSALTPAYSFTADVDTGFGRWDTNELFFATGGSRRLSIESDGAVDFLDSKIKVGSSLGSDGQVLTSTGSGAAWEDAASGGGGVELNLPSPSVLADTNYITLHSGPIFGNAGTASQPVGNSPRHYPFIAINTGTVSAFAIDVETAASGVNVLVGIYDTGTDGLPDSRLGFATISAAATGNIEQTTITGTISLVSGTQYWVAYCKDSNAGTPDCRMTTNNASDVSSFLGTGNTPAGWKQNIYTFDSQELPTSFPSVNIYADGNPRLCVGIKL